MIEKVNPIISWQNKANFGIIIAGGYYHAMENN